MESSKMAPVVRAMKAERELCVQDITTFKKWREGIKARKSKPWFVT